MDFQYILVCKSIRLGHLFLGIEHLGRTVTDGTDSTVAHAEPVDMQRKHFLPYLLDMCTSECDLALHTMHLEHMCQDTDLRIYFVDKPCLWGNQNSRHTQDGIQNMDRRDIRADKYIFRHCIGRSDRMAKDNKGRAGLVLALKLY